MINFIQKFVKFIEITFHLSKNTTNNIDNNNNIDNKNNIDKFHLSKNKINLHFR